MIKTYTSARQRCETRIGQIGSGNDYYRRAEHPDYHVFSNRFSVIQLKANCACGGSCPRCTDIQPQLKIGKPNDRYEQEADRVADMVMGMPESSVQRQVEPEEEEERIQTKSLSDQITPLIQRQVEPEEEEEVEVPPEAEEEEEPLQTKQRSSHTPHVAPQIATNINAMRGSGSPLPHSVRADFEARFGADFSPVRVHTDARAAETARSVNSRAFTVGRDVVFGAGQYSPETAAGKRLLAHELTHVVQQAKTRSSTTPIIQRQKKCTSKDDPDKIVSEHKVTPDTIKKPGDKVKISVTFACKVRSWNSIIETSDGKSRVKRVPKTKLTNKFEREWDGMKLFPKVRKFLVDDGEYRHRLHEVKYAYKYNPTTKTSEELFATGSKLISPTIKVKAREFKGTGTHHFHFTKGNASALAAIIRSEMGVGNETEQKAIAWAVRNQMIRLNTGKVSTARDTFHDAHDQAATKDTKKIAEEILKKPMSDDITQGAIKWFSPKSMPKKGEEKKCKPPIGKGKMNCSGGLITVTDDKGKKRQVYAPGFHKTMSHVPITGVREWFVRFYKLK